MKPEKVTSLKESLTNEPFKAPETEKAPIASSVPDGLAELRALEAELQGTPRAPSGGGTPSQGAGPSASNNEPGAGDGLPKRRRKFKKVPPENTIRLTIRQYWRLRDWMARRGLGLPSEYAGVFCNGKDSILVEPLVEPVIGCLDAYLPEEWIVFIEDKSPVLALIIALVEAEQTFSAAVNEAAKEKKKETMEPKPSVGSSTKKDDLPPRQKMPSLNETVGTRAKAGA